MLICPNDGTSLKPITVEQIAVDQCPTCEGYWLHKGELEQLGELHHTHLEPITAGSIDTEISTRKCPLDQTLMREHEFVNHTGIKIDQCPTCQGVWLEKDQLGMILKYLDEEHQAITLSQRVLLFLYQLT